MQKVNFLAKIGKHHDPMATCHVNPPSPAFLLHEPILLAGTRGFYIHDRIEVRPRC